MVPEPITRTIPRQFRTVSRLSVHPLVRIDAIDTKALKTVGNKIILVTAESIIAGFGSAVVAFRLVRELDIEENEEQPKHRKEHLYSVSDWLIVTTSIGALCFIVAPLVVTRRRRTIRYVLHQACVCDSHHACKAIYKLGI
jgi:hypothetical protein